MFSRANIAILLIAEGQDNWIIRAGYYCKNKSQELNNNNLYLQQKTQKIPFSALFFCH
jgi:hypothetical protein